MSLVTILCCYRSGTLKMMEACASAVVRHTSDIDYDFIIVTRDAKVGELDEVLSMFPIAEAIVMRLQSDTSMWSHARMLDEAVRNIPCPHEFVLSLDSDCLPVADGWLSGLVGIMSHPKVGAAGILHPWAPPPDMPRKMIEWRVRNQHCWETTHVACQLIRQSSFGRLGLKYEEGDDTGLGMIQKIKANGLICGGYKPTRCPVSRTTFDPEFNRYVGVVYGDKVYHHGGYTRTEVGSDGPILSNSFGWALDRVLEVKGAEWLLDDSVSYKYVFDKEADVAAEKMDRLFGFRKERKEE